MFRMRYIKEIASARATHQNCDIYICDAIKSKFWWSAFCVAVICTTSSYIHPNRGGIVMCVVANAILCLCFVYVFVWNKLLCTLGYLYLLRLCKLQIIMGEKTFRNSNFNKKYFRWLFLLGQQLAASSFLILSFLRLILWQLKWHNSQAQWKNLWLYQRKCCVFGEHCMITVGVQLCDYRTT